MGINDPPNQKIGGVNLWEGRVVVFPNTFQTKMNPFSIADPSRPCHLRILTLHLVDPNRRAMSTAMVPCQRRVGSRGETDMPRVLEAVHGGLGSSFGNGGWVAVWAWGKRTG